MQWYDIRRSKEPQFIVQNFLKQYSFHFFHIEPVSL